MIEISPTAIQEISRLRQKQAPNSVVQISLRSGGCLEWLYTLEFTEHVATDGNVIECANGLRVQITKQAQPYLEGLKLDYSEDLMGGSFRFHNPNAAQHCGCGNSFAIAPTESNSTTTSASEVDYQI